jgi:hypothetical protein
MRIRWVRAAAVPGFSGSLLNDIFNCHSVPGRDNQFLGLQTDQRWTSWNVPHTLYHILQVNGNFVPPQQTDLFVVTTPTLQRTFPTKNHTANQRYHFQHTEKIRKTEATVQKTHHINATHPSTRTSTASHYTKAIYQSATWHHDDLTRTSNRKLSINSPGTRDCQPHNYWFVGYATHKSLQDTRLLSSLILNF